MSESNPEPDAARTRLSPRLSRWIATVLGVLALLAVIAIVVELVVLRPRYAEAEETSQARADVARVAETFAVQFNTYGADNVETYQSSMNALLSTSAETAFENTFEQFEQLVRASNLTSKGEVLASAVASVDADSAQVLVVADAQARSDVGGAVDRHFRWEVDLVKVDGKWLVDDFTPVD